MLSFERVKKSAGKIVDFQNASVTFGKVLAVVEEVLVDHGYYVVDNGVKSPRGIEAQGEESQHHGPSKVDVLFFYFW